MSKPTHTTQPTQLTTIAGAPVVDNQNIMTAGPRGPQLLQDVWFLEKLAHFDREVIPERRMHEKGSGAHGTFTVIRVAADKCTPVGASVSRGGATNSPAAVYALTKYVDWMKKYAPKEATGMTFGEAGPVPAQGQIAQQIFWYTAFTADMTKPGLPVVNADGTPKWRMAPGPNGAYWKQGMQNGYQDAGSWTFFKDGDPNKTAAAWLYAQFITAKTTSLKKSIVGLVPAENKRSAAVCRFNHAHMHSPRQLTDLYLLALAVKNAGRLVGLDRRIALSAVKDAQATNLVGL